MIAIGGMIVQTVVNGMGVSFIAGYTATNKLYGLLEIAAVSYGYAISTYAGQNLGAKRMERVRDGVRAGLKSGIITALGLTYLVVHIGFRGGSFDLNAVIMLFLFAGLLLHKTPLAYVRAFGKAASGASGILLQFPFYAGIMGIITGVGASGTCLGTVLSNACVNGSGPITYPLLTFLCAALLNLFVPSGGGHWAIQAPIMFGAGEVLNVDHGLTGIAIAWGDAWTNLIQPFWALPALAIAKLQAKDIMGYCLIDLIVSGIIIVGGLLVWSVV